MNYKGETSWQHILREPFVHFVLLGGLLYLLFIYFSKPGPETIIITKQRSEYLIGAQERKLGRPLTAVERKQLLEKYSEEEILLREAYKQGMDQNDPRIRKRMIDKMKFSLYNTTESPDEQSLQTYYEKHKDRYVSGESISFRHIFFTRDQFEKQNDPDGILPALNRGDDPGSFGTSFSEGGEIDNRTRMDLIRIFGTSFTRQLEGLPVGKWFGPIDSKQGVHYVRITDRRITGYLPFDAVRLSVFNYYIQQQQKSELKHKIDSIKSGYQIIIESVNP